ncbi:hypothetical protein [Streptomyces coeruleorubidus]|uniref:hypothetical protein n=1 Tax=Streptomyces coeruleorubidus TaxID=116188 RepID=UPI00187605FF|nr:hypothetical protein [Streptomyces bellus]GGU07188.1 hypothetical protein GCM10010244_36640 [Streptomyces bellus]
MTVCKPVMHGDTLVMYEGTVIVNGGTLVLYEGMPVMHIRTHSKTATATKTMYWITAIMGLLAAVIGVVTGVVTLLA